MPNRPPIPAEISRGVLFESGHRCAVCGVSTPIERAHIIPWHKSKEHKKEDLICLCANCHQRADSEKWGEKTLRKYKERPWVMRQQETLSQTAPDIGEAQTSPRIVYCTYCGLIAGQPGKCTHSDGHRFLEAEPDCSVVYCMNCAVVPGGATQCLSQEKHSFVEAAPFCTLVYCERCGRSPGAQQECIDESGHQFVQAEPEKGYCPICGELNTAEKVFKCQKCWRSFICISHRDSKWSVCSECASSYKHEIVRIGEERRCRKCGIEQSDIDYLNIDRCSSHDITKIDDDLICRKCGLKIYYCDTNPCRSTRSHNFVLLDGTVRCKQCGGYPSFTPTSCSSRPHDFVLLGGSVLCRLCGRYGCAEYIPTDCSRAHELTLLGERKMCRKCGEIPDIDTGLSEKCKHAHDLAQVEGKIVCQKCGKERDETYRRWWFEECVS